MRFWIFSDLHLDVNQTFPFALPEPWPAHDAVIIAGDIGEGIARGIDWIQHVGLDARPVVYVPGNHEFYGHDRAKELERGRAVAAKHHNIHLLDRDSVRIGNVTVLGATLWTGYDIYGTPAESMAIAVKYMSDHRVIAEGDKVFSASAARAEHVASAAWLQRELAEVRGSTIVVTHHAPSQKSISPKFQGHPLTASFTNDLDHLFPGVSLWVHGHTHRVVDYTAAGCRVINNPRGYVRHEMTGFDPGLVVEVG